jgi:hypothetical protein
MPLAFCLVAVCVNPDCGIVPITLHPGYDTTCTKSVLLEYPCKTVQVQTLIMLISKVITIKSALNTVTSHS